MVNLIAKIKNLPFGPGVYQFFDANKNVIYIGKAKNLRARVRQYFNGDDERRQIPFLMKKAVDFGYTVVNTELESLYLERMLIQKHQPKYNIDLRDDKNYAFIKIDYSTEIPTVSVQRKLNTANSRGQKTNDYFGPFTSAKKIRDLIYTARKTFGLCANQKVSGKPCFYCHLHRCPGVCAGKMSLDDYRRHLEKIKLFFSGKISPTIKSLKTAMHKAAEQKKFERAARLRDSLKSLEILAARQNVIMTKAVNWDIVGLACDEGITCVNLFKIRGGRMLDKENFIYHNPQANLAYLNDPNLLEKFLEQYYTETSGVPQEIYLPQETKNQELIKTLIRDRFKKTVSILVPKTGKASYLLKLSIANASEYLKNYLNERAGNLDKAQRGLIELKTLLGLKQIPKRVEGFDISNIQGTHPVGSMVVFVGGLPKKSEYRKFKIKSQTTPDDFAMMREMLTRRFGHSPIGSKAEIRNPKSKPWPVPDLIVIDGGKGQLAAAQKALRNPNDKIQITDKSQNSKVQIPIISLAKRIEEIFIPDKKTPLVLPHNNPALQLLQRLRDEAHRFGITFHRQLRSKQAIKSALDDILGLGPKTKKLLKAKFGTVANVRKASLMELTKVVGKSLAKTIKEGL